MTSSWKKQDIRRLRQRLGWSVVEMARRMSCKTEMVVSWEQGESAPDVESRNHLNHLWAFVEAHAERMAQGPVAERLMKDRKLDQVTRDEVLASND